jgi:HlyD family secretion protein
MDRPIHKKTRILLLLRRSLAPLAAVALVVLAAAWIADWIRPSVRRQDIRTARVQRGPMEATISAAGTVVPLDEHVITSPIDTRVTRILLTPGAQLSAGQPIVELDVGETEAALATLDDQIALKQNQRQQILLNHAREKAALQTRRDIKNLKLQSREYEAERCRQYFDEGLFSSDEVRKAELEAEKTRIELRQMDESLDNLVGALKAELEGLDLEITIHRRDYAEALRRLELATATSDRDGVLTWVVAREGMAVQRGDELARVADLTTFRVEATVSDIHASRLAERLPVVIESNDQRLTGQIAQVRPMVENGIITLDIALDDNSSPILRHNLRVDVYVITERAGDGLRVQRGPFMTPDGTHAVFVIRGDVAVRTPVLFGITNVDYYQILEGLSEGDEIIISDMSDSIHATEVRLR